MIFLAKLGSTFYRKSQKLLLHLKASRPKWRIRQKNLSRPSELIVVMNITQLHLMSFVKLMELDENLPLYIQHNRMLYQRGKTEQF